MGFLVMATGKPNRLPNPRSDRPLPQISSLSKLQGGDLKSLFLLLVSGVILFSGCGGGSSSSSQNTTTGPLSGNWQFTLADQSLQGGFLLQDKDSVTGAVVYSIGSPACNSGSAPMTGTFTGQNVTLMAVAGGQTYSLTGTLSADHSTMMGTYTSTAGQSCGTAQSGAQWSAVSVPPLSGTIQGSVHNVTGNPALLNQNFSVTGVLSQGPNIGASNATIVGTLNFQNYPCMDTASVNGQISGRTVILQVIATNGLTVGQIGAPPGLSTVSPVVLESAAQGGYLLHGASGYGVTTKACPGIGVPGDLANICLGLGNTTACAQPISLSPAFLTFPPQGLGSTPTLQTITLTNTDPAGSTLSGLSLAFLSQPPSTNFPVSDFNGLPNFTEQDNCAPSLGSPFSLAPQQSCSITVSFSPQQSCPWLPSTAAGGTPPAQCPIPLNATLTVQTSSSADSNNLFATPIAGIGLSAVVPSVPELDFGAEALNESSPAQILSFTNQGSAPVQILPALSTPCASPLTRPLTPGAASGLQVVTGVTSFNATVNFLCDIDLISNQPIFPISADTCSGTVLAPQQPCSLQVRFVPQPGTPLTPPPDYFLELNTLQCTSTTTSNCEIDSGRFPVELKTNAPSPLRMSPGAGMDFGIVAVGEISAPQAITLTNASSQTVNFTGNLVKGDYLEFDDCGTSLAPGNSCTLTVSFKPKIVGLDPGTITITYTVGQTQTVFLRGSGL